MNKKSIFVKVFGIATTISLLLSTSLNVFAVTTSTFTTKVFSDGKINNIQSVTNQDDITLMGGKIFIGCQNGVGSDGAPSKSGITNSTVQEFDQTGKLITSWSIKGKCDGLTADVAKNRIIATVNEDKNSSMDIITPSSASAKPVTFIPAAGKTLPAGGTDSITFQNGNMYISASNPTADAKGKNTTAALFQAVINSDNTATLTPVIMDNSLANNATPGAAAGAKVTLNMSDPDSNNLVPAESAKFAGQFVLDNQGDKQLIFTDNIGKSNQVNTMLPVSNAINDIEWATSTKGTLYLTDTGSNKVYAITGTFPVGTAFVAASDDHFIGTINLNSGAITPLDMGNIKLNKPAGLLFVPATPTTTNTTTKTVAKNTLPQTGSTFDTTVLVIAGVGLIVGGLWITFKKKAEIQ